MQGKIGVLSTVDVGSEFWVEFKLMITPELPKVLHKEPEPLVN